MNLDKYKITRLETDELKPEETLADALSIHSTIEIPISQRVFTAFYIGIVLAVSLLVLKSFQLQIINGSSYVLIAEQNSSSNYQLTPLRGIIYDVSGRPMVENAPVFDLVAVHRYLPNLPEEIEKIINQLMPIVGVSKDGLLKLFEENQDNGIFAVKRGLSKEEKIRLDNLGLSGIYVVANAQRNYFNGAASAHLIGYTAQVSLGDLEKDPYYFINDRIGRLGLEAQYEKELRGRHRSIDFVDMTVDNDGDSGLGNNIFLNIDSLIQKKLYQSLNSVFISAGVRRGAAIIQNPKTGAVLALVSMPSFDNNIFENSSRLENAAKISKILNSNDKPLLNRVISGQYSPGSTIKPLLALVGLKEGVITPSTLIFANGSISVRSEIDPNIFYTFRDWKVHGWTDIKKAIADSVDVYFYSLGGGYGSIKYGLGIDRIAAYFKGAGADKITGIDLPREVNGLVPSREWKKETKGESWYVGDTYNISIGQGDLGITLVWLNTYIGSIANGGKLMKPYIVRRIDNPDGQVIAGFSEQVLNQMPFDQNTMNIVRQGMRQTVLSGTATPLQDIPVALAAKTGTAQVTGRGLNSLFTIFGPFDEPEIVMTVLVENTDQSQGLAIKVAKDFLLWYFGNKKE